MVSGARFAVGQGYGLAALLGVPRLRGEALGQARRPSSLKAFRRDIEVGSAESISADLTSQQVEVGASLEA